MIILHVQYIKSHTQKNVKLFLLIVMKSAVNSSDKLSMAVIQAEQYHDLVLDSVIRGWNLQNKKNYPSDALQ